MRGIKAVEEAVDMEVSKAKQQWQREKETEKRTVVIKMIKKGINTIDICDIAECSEEYVADIRKSLQ